MVGSPSKKNAPYRDGFDIRTYRYDYIVTYSILKFNPKNSIKFGNFPEFIGTKNELEENVPIALRCRGWSVTLPVILRNKIKLSSRAK